MKRMIQRRVARKVSDMGISWQSTHAGRPLKGLIPAQPKGVAAMLVSVPGGRNAVTGESGKTVGKLTREIEGGIPVLTVQSLPLNIDQLTKALHIIGELGTGGRDLL